MLFYQLNIDIFINIFNLFIWVLYIYVLFYQLNMDIFINILNLFIQIFILRSVQYFYYEVLYFYISSTNVKDNSFKRPLLCLSKWYTSYIQIIKTSHSKHYVLMRRSLMCSIRMLMYDRSTLLSCIQTLMHLQMFIWRDT